MLTKVSHCVFISTKLKKATTYFEQCADNNKTEAVTGKCQK